MYGDQLKTFNINPHSGGNKPIYSQVHGRTLLGGTVQIRGPGSIKKMKNGTNLRQVRRPVPPRIAPSKSMENLKQKHAGNTKVTPETFAEVGAKELTIMPPKFSSKNLKNKTKVEQKKKVFKTP